MCIINYSIIKQRRKQKVYADFKGILDDFWKLYFFIWLPQLGHDGAS